MSIFVIAIFVSLFSIGCEFESARLKSSPKNTNTQTGVSGQLGDNQWPNLYGPENSGFSRELGIRVTWQDSGPRKLWSRDIGKGYSAPIIVNKKLVVAHRIANHEIITCFDSLTGQTNWEVDYPTNFECSYEYSDGPYSTAVANDSHVFFVSGEGHFYCIELATGNVKWKRELLNEYEVKLNEWPVTCSPLLLRDRIIFNLGAAERNAGIVALDIETGNTVWESTDHNWAHATPVSAKIYDKDFVFVVTREGLVSLDPENGHEYWSIRHQTRRVACYNAVSPVIWKDLVCFVTGPNTGIRCLQIQPDGSFSEPWKNRRLLDSQYTNLICREGFLYGFMSAGQGGPDYKCIDLRTGKLMYKAKPDIGRATQLAVNDHILLFGENGDLATIKLNPRSYTEVCRSNAPVLEKPCYTSPSLCDGLLYLRNEKEIVCFDLRVESISNDQNVISTTKTSR